MLRSIVRKGEPQELPLFDFYIIAVATNNFSMANKLGQGGYGPVYKTAQLDGLGGIFSEKSDVFSFGVSLLEIVSSKKVPRFLYDDEHLSLLSHDHAENRPTMAAVISMLSGKTELLQLKEPFFTFHNPSKFDQPKDNNPCPICEITMSTAEGQ
ncbi:hypothetical protein SLEP1_g29479 [Rubroshorea leprosula]|uniref:Protein kinase domain-containing protein n=1 Tax=Rubroshorea leprosula TaxID=152421 RepID=A0AAV5K5F2_9ROSI|nr:hypothetical protein SLEP1_g29479 [Rubroshorea leprosula]